MVYAKLKTGEVVKLASSLGETVTAVSMTVAATHADRVLLGSANFLDDVEVPLDRGGSVVWGDIAEIREQ